MSRRTRDGHEEEEEEVEDLWGGLEYEQENGQEIGGEQLGDKRNGGE